MPLRELLVMRHAKSDWDAGATSDHARPLSKRGRRDCIRIAAWLDEQGLQPDLVLHSSAERAADTARRVVAELGTTPRMKSDSGLYLTGVTTLVEAIRHREPRVRRLLLVGHNPGMDSLVEWLSNRHPPRAENGKLMPTAAVAWFRVPLRWRDLVPQASELVDLVRPREL